MFNWGAMVNFQVYEGQSSNLIVFLVGKLLLIDHNKGFWPIDSFTAISIRWWYHRHILTTGCTGCHQLTMKETATISNGHCPHSACHGPLNIMSDFRPVSVPSLYFVSQEISETSWLGKFTPILSKEAFCNGELNVLDTVDSGKFYCDTDNVTDLDKECRKTI